MTYRQQLDVNLDSLELPQASEKQLHIILEKELNDCFINY